MKALSFDFGQTLGELDYEFLSKRLLERGTLLDARAAASNGKRAWHVYGQRKLDGHALAWRSMMETQLTGGGVSEQQAPELAAWLWTEQPQHNLWRRPIPGMIELVRELGRGGVPLAIISNSEGHLDKLVADMGWDADFNVVVDSGRIGIDKPDPRIFLQACAALEVGPTDLLHVGDAWEADVQGALGASASAVWFDTQHRERTLPERVYGAGNAAELREVLARLGLVS